MSLTLSAKHGLNPSVETCAICGKDMSVVCFGAHYKDENGKHTEAPHKICMGHYCEDCQKVIDNGGIFFIEVLDGQSGNNPYRTGRLCAVKEEAVKRMFHGYAKVNYMEQSLFTQVFSEATFQ